MNILPLVFALIFMLSILTIEKLDNYKNRTLIHQQYEKTLELEERAEFNDREDRLYKNNKRISFQQTPFRLFLKKDDREKNEAKYRQFRFVAIHLIKELYGKAAFYKAMEQKRPDFVEELLNAIQDEADKMHEKSIRQVEDAARIKLNDPELQAVFYKMLKGTINKKTCKEPSSDVQLDSERAYFPLLSFFNFNGMDIKIKIRLAPKELLRAIYGTKELADRVFAFGEELSKQLRSKKPELTPDEAQAKFRNEFEGKQSPEIIDILDYSINKSSQAKRA